MYWIARDGSFKIYCNIHTVIGTSTGPAIGWQSHDYYCNVGDSLRMSPRWDGKDDKTGCVPETRTRAGMDGERCTRVIILAAAGECL